MASYYLVRFVATGEVAVMRFVPGMVPMIGMVGAGFRPLPEGAEFTCHALRVTP